MKINGTVGPITNGTPKPVDAAEAFGESAKQQEISVTDINTASVSVDGESRPLIDLPNISRI